MDIPHRMARWLAHTRFVPTPLYRLVLVAAFISGVLQLYYGAPLAILEESSATWFEWTFVGVQMVSALAAIGGLYLVEGADHPADPAALHRSLSLELLGLIGLQTVGAWQITATTLYFEHIPSGFNAWMLIVFLLWSFFRVRDILRALRKLTR